MASSVAALSSLDFSLQPEGIAARVQGVIAQAKTVLDAVGAHSTGAEATFSAVIAPLAALERDLEGQTAAITFLKDVSTDKAVRDASSAAQAALSAFDVEAGMREDVYAAVCAFSKSPEAEGLDAEAARWVSRALRDYTRRGLDKDKETREKIKETLVKISDKCSA